MTTFRNTLRQLANEQDRDERARLSDVFASELELAFNRQSGNAQAAISDVEEGAWQRMERLHAAQADTNTLLSRVIEALAALRTSVDASAAESAARWGKTEAAQAAQAAELKNVLERLDRKRERIDDHEVRLLRLEAWQRSLGAEHGG